MGLWKVTSPDPRMPNGKKQLKAQECDMKLELQKAGRGDCHQPCWWLVGAEGTGSSLSLASWPQGLPSWIVHRTTDHLHPKTFWALMILIHTVNSSKLQRWTDKSLLYVSRPVPSINLRGWYLRFRDAGAWTETNWSLLNSSPKAPSPERAGIGEEGRGSRREAPFLLPWGHADPFHQHWDEDCLYQHSLCMQLFPIILPNVSFCTIHFKYTGQRNLSI